MAKQDDYVRYTIRVPADLYERLQKAAGEKSVNAEIVERLDRSFYVDTERDFLTAMAEGKFIEPLPPGLAGRIQSQAEARGQSVQEEVIQALEAAFPPPPTEQAQLLQTLALFERAVAAEGQEEHMKATLARLRVMLSNPDEYDVEEIPNGVIVNPKAKP